MRATLLMPLLFLAACAGPPPHLEDQISPEARATDPPQLIPLAPILDIDALLPEDPAATGRSLEARAADLRRRAAALRAMAL